MLGLTLHNSPWVALLSPNHRLECKKKKRYLQDNQKTSGTVLDKSKNFLQRFKNNVILIVSKEI